MIFGNSSPKSKNTNYLSGEIGIENRTTRARDLKFKTNILWVKSVLNKRVLKIQSLSEIGVESSYGENLEILRRSF